jgi:hypothetical protein
MHYLSYAIHRPDTSPRRETGHIPSDKGLIPSQNRDTWTRLSRVMPSGVGLLSPSQLNLTIAPTLPGRALVIRYGYRTLAVRRGAQSVTWRGPKVKRCGVHRDLYITVCGFHAERFVEERDIRVTGGLDLRGYPRSRHRLAPI